MSNIRKSFSKDSKKYCGPNCKGPFDGGAQKRPSSGKPPCKCESDANKCSCIKPWLDKAAEKMNQRRASSSGPSTTSRLPIPTAQLRSASASPTRSPCPPCSPGKPSYEPLEEIDSFKSACTTQDCKIVEGGKKVCSNKPECKKKFKKDSCATTCKIGKRPCPKKHKVPTCGQPMPSSLSGNPCDVCSPLPCGTCPRPQPPKPPCTPPPETPKPPPAPKPPADKPPADKPPADKPPADKPPADKPAPAPAKPPDKPTPPPEVKPVPPDEKPPPKPAKPVTPKPSEEKPLPRPDEQLGDEHEEERPEPPHKPAPKPPSDVRPPPSKPPPDVCQPCPKGRPCPPCPPCLPCAPAVGAPCPPPCSSPCSPLVSGDSAHKTPCPKAPPCPPVSPKPPPICPQGDQNAYFVGVDVGTGSARAALVKDNGEIVETFAEDIKTWNVKADFYEQSSDNIWDAVCTCVMEVVSNVNAEAIRGIGFDATCSLVCVDQNGQPLSVSPTGKDEQNIILWLDHRAIKEADDINKTNHPVLTFVGGKVFPEQEIPKLMWLKRHMKEKCWNKAGYFFDLPDFLTWRATDADSRSICSLVCKWNYEMKLDGSKVEGTNGWNKVFFEKIDLTDLSESNWKKIGSKILVPGCPVGQGLSSRAAKELGLNAGTPVGASMIDAHAGGLGLIGTKVPQVSRDYFTRLCLICGTSTCHMAVSDDPILTPGIWGPYRHAMIAGMWLNEGGQSATGKLIDHIIQTHPAFPEVKKQLKNMYIQEYLNVMLNKMSGCGDDLALLTTDLHVWPDFHGNRSPIADPSLKGMISGLTLDTNAESLALIYLATLQALAYGARHIIDRLRCCGYTDLQSLLICGGLSKNDVFVKTLADACKIPVLIPSQPESVLLGAAMLGARACGYFPDMDTTILKMSSSGNIVQPDSKVTEYHDRKYKVFLKMYEDQMDYRRIMRCLCKQCMPDHCTCV